MEESSWLKRVVHAICGMFLGAIMVLLCGMPESKESALLWLGIGALIGGLLAGLFLDRFWDKLGWK